MLLRLNLILGESYQYTCSKADGSSILDAHYLCIQCPSTYGELTGHKTKTITLDIGDINFDGKIDMEDYNLLARYTAEGPEEEVEKLRWTPTPKQLAVMNCRQDTEYHKEHINVDDAIYLYNYIKGIGGITSLGTVFYDIDVVSDYEEGLNVSNLLIIDGHYDSSVNIPFMDFVSDDWIIHEKFFNYLLGMAIHKYSNSEDITYLQKLLKEAYPEHSYDKNFFYAGSFSDNMRSILKEYQCSKVSYTTGDLNKDNKLTNEDLVMLRNYIDDSSSLTLIEKYLTDPEKYPLTAEQITSLDKDGDGVITDTDRQAWDKEIGKLYSSLLRARADINGDGFVDEIDYNLLKSEIEGKTDKLKEYDITFALGWLDVQTEAILESDVNAYGLISEVNK